LNESGAVNKAYIRSEDRLYFNFTKGDIWDVYMALEFDDVLSARTVDRARDSQGDLGSFGLERVAGSIKLPWILSRFYAGWDIYAVDLDAALLVYGDDDPGFWLKGGVGNVEWQFGYHKKDEANRRLVANRNAANNIVNTGGDNDRDILSARLNYELVKGTKVGLIYTWDRLAIRFGGTPTNDPCQGPLCPEVDSQHIGLILTSTVGPLKFTGEYVHQFGEARKTRITNAAVTDISNANYNIDANAFYADLAYDLTPWAGFRLIPHVGVLWASGDDNPNDNRLGGYVGNVDGTRFTPGFGGENTIIGDNNNVVGTNLYAFVPNLRGNQHSGLATGGFLGNGRGDSPGILLVGGGVTVAPTKNSIYRTNAYYMQYDERPCVNNTGPLGPLSDFTLLAPPSACPSSNIINSREIGVEWDNELMVWLDKNMVVKGQFSFLFPGEAIKDITRTLVGKAVDETAIRLAMEFLWNF
jgi:hypothetical protein